MHMKTTHPSSETTVTQVTQSCKEVHFSHKKYVALDILQKEYQIQREQKVDDVLYSHRFKNRYIKGVLCLPYKEIQYILGHTSKNKIRSSFLSKNVAKEFVFLNGGHLYVSIEWLKKEAKMILKNAC